MALITRILVPTDFSDCAKRALEYSAELASKLSASVVLLHVYMPPIVYMPEGVWTLPDAMIDVRNDLEQALNKLAVQARELGVRQVDTAVIEGDPAHQVVKHAEKERCDLIVMGTHGRGALKHLVLGSVAEKVVRRASCPVLTVGPRAEVH